MSDGEAFDKARLVGFCGTMDNGCLYRMNLVSPLSCEAERQEMLELIDLFRRMVVRMPLSIHATAVAALEAGGVK